MQSKASTVAAYLASLPADRRAVVEHVHRFVMDNLDPGFQAGMAYGMISYSVPLETYPIGYHCDPKLPLGFGGLAAQKNAYSLYLMCLYLAPKREKDFRAAWSKTGKKLDMGKACIRFHSLDDLAFDVIAKTLKSISMKGYIQTYESLLGPARLEKARKAAAKLRPQALGAAGSGAATKPNKPAAAKTAKKTGKKVAKKAARKVKKVAKRAT